VSTLAEARYFAAEGWRDITYAVGLAPSRLAEAVDLVSQGVRLTLLTDNLACVEAAAGFREARGAELRFLVEIDCGGRRGGVEPESSELIAVARAIHERPGLSLAGVLTHAGQSYHASGPDALRRVAEEERAAVVRAAERLRASGLPCDTVSAGSTPTAVHAACLDGVTEMRPGVYVFFDLDQVGIGSCDMSDLALSVIATVIGHNRRAGRILIDAGGLALSKDNSAREFLADVGYGLVCGLDDGAPLEGLYVAEVHQEHGLIAAVAGEPPFEAFPLGRKVRILPNHACMTAAAHEAYWVTDGFGSVIERWERVNGWG
jgi:D-serine deaminase-like pyridoxal phosphate-dependent protein